MLIGYMRVSKTDGSQATDLQYDALVAAGHTGVRYLRGGVLAWVADVDPDAPTY